MSQSNITGTDTEKTLTITRTFNTSKETLWRAWTNPEQISKWWGPSGVTNPECEIDPHPGGRISIVMLAGPELGPLAGQRWPMQGVFEEVSEPDKLVFSNQALDDDGNVIINGRTTVTFTESEGKTTLTLITTAKAMTEQAKANLAGMQMGWSQSIDKLETYLA